MAIFCSVNWNFEISVLEYISAQAPDDVELLSQYRSTQSIRRAIKRNETNSRQATEPAQYVSKRSRIFYAHQVFPLLHPGDFYSKQRDALQCRHALCTNDLVIKHISTNSELSDQTHDPTKTAQPDFLPQFSHNFSQD